MVFRFRLERVLRYREEQEREALVAFARTQAQRELVFRGLEVLEKELEEAKGFFNALKGARVEAQEILLVSRRWKWLALERERQSQLLQEWDKKVEKAQELWLHARAAKEVLLKLRQRALREFVQELERAETRQLDEAGLRVFSPGGSSGANEACLNSQV